MKRKENGIWWIAGAAALAFLFVRSMGTDLVRYIRITRM